MDVNLVIALVAAAAALGSAAFTAVMAARQARSDREFKAKTDAELERLRHDLNAAFREENRSLKAKEVLDRYRRPLLAAAVSLARRIENIRHRSFLVYLGADEHRARVALRSILYRFAAYLGWRELLNRELTYLDFEDSEQTKEVLGLLDDVRAKLSSSRFDIVENQPRLMLWTDEQAAIGGLMLTTEGTAGIIGFEAFFENYDGKFSPWLSSFADDLQRPGVEGSTRLREIAAVLDDLIKRLDVEGVYGEHPEHSGGWQRADASRETAASTRHPSG
jgi:hypothetical protein